MKRSKIRKTIVVFLTVATLFSSVALNAAAYSYTWANSNGNSTVYNCPNSGSMQVGSIGVERVKVYWQENGYYYIEYTVDSGDYGGYKRGYVPTSKINISGIGSCKYPSWNSRTFSNQTVYNRPGTNSYVIGTVYSTDTIAVLDMDNGWYYIQYPVSGGYKRGYVPYNTVYKPYALLGSPYKKFTTGNYNLTYSYTKIGTTSFYWDNWIATAVEAWNTSTANVFVTSTTSSSANIKFYSGNYGDIGWYGYTNPPSDSQPDLAIIKLNDYYHDGNEAETVAHEMGHAFLLAHVNTVYHTLMINIGFKGSPNPTDPDIMGVNATYTY